MNVSWKELVACAQVDGAALVSSSTPTSLLPGAAKATLLQNFFDKVGKKLTLRAAGRISTLATSPGTFTFDVRFGSIVVWNGGAINLNATAQVNASWELLLEMTLRALGSGTGANLIGVGRWNSRAVVGSAAAAAGGVGSIVLPDTAPAVGSGFDSTAAQIVDLFGTWSVNSASNSIQLHTYSLWADN